MLSTTWTRPRNWRCCFHPDEELLFPPISPPSPPTAGTLCTAIPSACLASPELEFFDPLPDTTSAFTFVDIYDPQQLCLRCRFPHPRHHDHLPSPRTLSNTAPPIAWNTFSVVGGHHRCRLRRRPRHRRLYNRLHTNLVTVRRRPWSASPSSQCQTTSSSPGPP